ncbi:MAG: methionine--tRNA ligase [bacterium]|nr:methionine--tRNA ligase [bacterium]
MPDKKSFYITTTLPYVNAEPHIGFAMELVHADVVARAKQLQGEEVFFNTGTDEHGVKIYTKAKQAGKDPQKYADEYAAKFRNLIDLLGIDKTSIHFIRTTDEHHKIAAQEIWKLCEKAGDIYKKNYTIRYCNSCELEKTDSELVNGLCAIHPEKELEVREEENYFFKFSKYQELLLKFYRENTDFVLPDFRFNEIIKFVERGLEDFSISRLKSKMPWGIAVPGDEKHVMYVWFDALTNYISTIGWPDNIDEFKKWWPVVQFAGKDQTRQQAAMWQAMLMSSGLTSSKQIIIHGFLNFQGQKMSKSVGNVISPNEVIEKFGLDALRYFVTREFNQFEDTDVSWEKFNEAYNANLANGLGNLVSRIMTLAETNLSQPAEIAEWEDMSEHFSLLNSYKIKDSADHVWAKIGELDKEIQKKKPWESKDKEVIANLVAKLYSIARMLNPFMPITSAKIKSLIKSNKKPLESLFPRIES